VKTVKARQESVIDWDIVKDTAEALDMQPEAVAKQKTLCILLTMLFGNSPHRARGNLGMYFARARLSHALLWTMEKAETERVIADNPSLALVLSDYLEQVKATVDRLIRLCKANAPENGNSQGRE
jgi:hypothetical protein